MICANISLQMMSHQWFNPTGCSTTTKKGPQHDFSKQDIY